MKQNEEGASAVIVALLLVVLFGVGALVVDIGNVMWERRMLQNSADAAVLAAAQDIAAGDSDILAEQTARAYATENNSRGAFVDSFEYNPDESTVTVVTRTGDENDPGILTSWLAGAIGQADYFATAQATALIEAATGGAAFPVIISYCEWEAFLENPEEFGDDDFVPEFKDDFQTLYLLDPNDNTGDCTGPSGHQAPGGWGWLDPDSGECSAYVDEEGWVDGNTGGAPQPAATTGCSDAFFDDLVASEQAVLVPIFEEDNDLPGDNHQFKIMGFAGFELDGYRIGGSRASDPAPCSNPNRCFRGRFTEYVSLAQYAAGEYGTFDLGAREIYLIG